MIDRILDFNKSWISKLSIYRIWIGFRNEIVRLDQDLKNLNPFISAISYVKLKNIGNVSILFDSK